MLPVRQRRPVTEGFLALIPADASKGLKALVKEINDSAHSARNAGENSRALAMDAAWADEIGLPTRARRDINGAAVDHRLACAKLAELAAACRRLMCWAALDWRPSLDVAGSGLTDLELACLSNVMGREALEEVRSDADGSR